jgi:hypothetical protein
VAGAEGQYHAAVSDKEADRLAAWAAGGVIAGLPPSEQLERRFLAAQSQAQADWLAGMSGHFTTYATAMATAEADEIIALAQALAAFDNSRAQADVTRTAGVEPVYYNQRIGSHTALRSFAESETTRVNALRLAQANAYQLLDVANATAARDQAIAYATAEGDYWVGFFQGQPTTTLAHARDLAKADADVAHVTGRGNGALVWTTSISAAHADYLQGSVAGRSGLYTTLADIQRDTIIDCTPHEETHFNAYAAADAALWAAEVAAASARHTAETTAIANYTTADYAETVSSVAGIDTAINLPWTNYQADLAAALSAWWVNTERANYLAWAGAINSAETVYQTTVNAAFLAWANSMALAERNVVMGAANQRYEQTAADIESNRAYEHALAELDEAWQVNHATARRTFDLAAVTNQRNFVDTGDQQALEAAMLLATSARAAAEAGHITAYTVGEANAAGLRSTIVAGDWEISTGEHNTGSLAYVTSTANADKDCAIAESNANYARLAAIALADANYDVARADSLESALDALAAASNAPWATCDADVAAAEAAFTDTVAPALAAYLTEVADAERDLETAVASALAVQQIAVETHQGNYRTSVAAANGTRVVGEVAADTALSQTVPIDQLATVRAEAAFAVGQNAQAGAAPQGERPDGPPTPIGQSQEGDGTPIPHASSADAQSGTESPIPMPLGTSPPDQSDFNQGFFVRPQIKWEDCKGYRPPPPTRTVLDPRGFDRQPIQRIGPEPPRVIPQLRAMSPDTAARFDSVMAMKEYVEQYFIDQGRKDLAVEFHFAHLTLDDIEKVYYAVRRNDSLRAGAQFSEDFEAAFPGGPPGSSRGSAARPASGRARSGGGSRTAREPATRTNRRTIHRSTRPGTPAPTNSSSSNAPDTGGWKYVPRKGMDYIIVKTKDGRAVPIFGQSLSSSTTEGHASTILAHARALAESGDYAVIFMQRSWRTASNREATSRLIPDIIARRKDGKFDAWEVRSNSQDAMELRIKLRAGMDSVPLEWQGEFKILDPDPE